MWVGKCLIELIPHFLYFYFTTQRQSNLTRICQPYELQKDLPSIFQGVNPPNSILNPILKQSHVSEPRCTRSIPAHLLDGWPSTRQRENTHTLPGTSFFCNIVKGLGKMEKLWACIRF